MIGNAHRLAPQDGRRWREYASRVIQNPARDKALTLLDGGSTAGIPKQLILEGCTHADDRESRPTGRSHPLGGERSPPVDPAASAP